MILPSPIIISIIRRSPFDATLRFLVIRLLPANTAVKFPPFPRGQIYLVDLFLRQILEPSPDLLPSPNRLVLVVRCRNWTMATLEPATRTASRERGHSSNYSIPLSPPKMKEVLQQIEEPSGTLTRMKIIPRCPKG